MPERHIHHPRLVTDDAELARLCSHWREASILALDTEFLRERTYYPIPGLVQLCDGEGIFLLDAVALQDWSPFADLLTQAGLPKVMHAAGEDLEVFQRLAGVAPEPLYDTQIGAALAGLGFSLGYQALVDRCIGVPVPKDQTRTDWTRRPLSPEQLVYAARDVAYLPSIYQQLRDSLEPLGRLDWWREESAVQGQLLATAHPPETVYRRIKGAWHLSPRGLAALRALAAWREVLAREKDIPRGFVVKDPLLLEIAQRMPERHAALADIQGLGQGFVRQHGDVVLGLLEQVRRMPEAERPEPLAAPLDRAQTAVLKQLRQCAQQRAEALNLAPEILARKQDCEQLLRNGLAGQATLPDGLRGWRENAIGMELVECLREALAAPGSGAIAGEPTS